MWFTRNDLAQLWPTEIAYKPKSDVTFLTRVAHLMPYFNLSKLNLTNALKAFETYCNGNDCLVPLITPCGGVGAQSAAPGPSKKCHSWWGQWCDINDVIVLSQPWYDLLIFEDLFARTSAKFSVKCWLLNLPEHYGAGPNTHFAQPQLVIATTCQQSIRTTILLATIMNRKP